MPRIQQLVGLVVRRSLEDSQLIGDVAWQGEIRSTVSECIFFQVNCGGESLYGKCRVLVVPC